MAGSPVTIRKDDSESWVVVQLTCPSYSGLVLPAMMSSNQLDRQIKFNRGGSARNRLKDFLLILYSSRHTYLVDLTHVLKLAVTQDEFIY